ncbi:MAG: sigma-70 family RNA polymerase sigma factor [Bacteroidaceae bacterium]|nr:sigma-70 family RNA polymerase sigma factor [Bacteroidaceae bacterium]
MERKEIQRLFKLYYTKMYRVARTILYDEQESKDVVSDIFANLLETNTVLMPNTEENYLLTSVRNQCFKRIRHQEVIRRMEELFSTEQSIESNCEDERLTDVIEYAVSHLSEEEQRIFNYRFTEGYSYLEIAAHECISKVAVWKHLSHSLTVLRNHFNPQKS